jgi:hypothetical protein
MNFDPVRHYLHLGIASPEGEATSLTGFQHYFYNENFDNIMDKKRGQLMSCPKGYFMDRKSKFPSLWVVGFQFLTIGVSIFALWQSCSSLKVASRALDNSERESLLIHVSNYILGVPQPFPAYQVNIRSTVIKHGNIFNDQPLRNDIVDVHVDNYWSCLISNLGHRTVSLVEFAVWRDGIRDLQRSEFFEMPDKPINLPISFAPGESKGLLLRTSVKLGDQAIDVLYRKDKLINPLMSDEVFSILLNAGIDHYGNHIWLVPKSGANWTFACNGGDFKNANQERFELKMKTGMGKYFSDKFFWYKLPKF